MLLSRHAARLLLLSGVLLVHGLAALGLGGCAGAPPSQERRPTAYGETSPVRSRESFAAALRRYDEAAAASVPAPQLAALREHLAVMAAQRDAHVSRLYWHTDLDIAKAEAARLHRPILSLRMLGRLDEELSCANSRFFRTTLYANPAVAAVLRERFVLHWSSERPAPKLTLDFGDGHRVVRTVTGNSIHYVLDERGRPVDALPGLYAAAQFAEELARIERVARDVAPRDDAAARDLVGAHHARESKRQELRFADLATNARLPGLALPATPRTAMTAPPAALAVNVAVPKAVVERPLIGALTGPPTTPPSTSNVEVADGPAFERIPWAALAATFSPKIDPVSVALMRAKAPRDWDGHGGRASGAAPQPMSDAAFARMVDAFERTLAIDTLKNELGVRRAIHARMLENPGEDLAALNAWVYGALFLTPASDPWLGLMPAGVYTGLANDGLVQ